MPRLAAKTRYFYRPKDGSASWLPLDEVPTDPETIKAQQGVIVIGETFFCMHVTFEDDGWAVRVPDENREWEGYATIAKRKSLQEATKLARRLERFRPSVYHEDGVLFPEEARYKVTKPTIAVYGGVR